VSEEGRTPNHR